MLMTTTPLTAERLTGQWTVTSVINGEPAPWSSVVEFHTDHTVLVSGPDGPDGKPSFTGSGHWADRPDGSFMYYLSHPVPDGSGAENTVYSMQLGTVAGDTHTTSGSAIMHLPDGSVAPPLAVTLQGTR
jgi:hypothetical protein